ncbi:glutathione peroxidase [Clostridium acetobutylicum]|uniref:Glutathione peroxidase n=1 Tax=Clostridium acetobutylicum (strain ATCC 824 / DSM 792 / JCM 1419 / IAM 19013 / LMG 5710 / NBRC 13948 / NRRL B-527 / VKM B-1787 / 2291 / W) TaxID=272562 RepID=Q97IU1_CLOAB|nr:MULTISPECIES: glutathione peroxidase [Clostridium]AAK79516.1 Glutathione peroxidase [Clostridium acetobutylicum ATCC 824]ADZ20601.1 Glutathione peroxidase [Clostridium acetobutylicum EA 2018]AEI33510.1 glutathione peroxidase [Clostridium acetobutylicum DSM 1731]AWV81239.1 glutathione peroxidase [Clostridium acetobutylicum]MBC2392872.1 glutathione peroxidase [Clostridium acetobutylicum]
MSVYDFKAKTIEGKEVSLDTYKGKVLIIANTASKCGFTPQYEGLEKLYKEYKDKGLEILGFPSNQFAEQEPGDNNEVKNFCKLNYGVTFQLFEKTDVRDENAHPLFNYLTENAPFKGFDLNHPTGKMLSEVLEKNFPKFLEGNSVKWNFTKFLIDRDGNVVKRFEPTSEPSDMVKDIEKLL